MGLSRREHARKRIADLTAEYEFLAYRGDYDQLDAIEKKIDGWEQELYKATIDDHYGLGLGGSVKTLLYDEHLDVKP